MLPNDSGKPLSYHNFTDEKENCYYSEVMFFAFSVILIFTTIIWSYSKSGYLQMIRNIDRNINKNWYLLTRFYSSFYEALHFYSIGVPWRVINLEQNKRTTLLGFHALSGVDITGSFTRKCNLKLLEYLKIKESIYYQRIYRPWSHNQAEWQDLGSLEEQSMSPVFRQKTLPEVEDLR